MKQDGIKIAQRNINNLRYADDTTLMAESDTPVFLPGKSMDRGLQSVGLQKNWIWLRD